MLLGSVRQVVKKKYNKLNRKCIRTPNIVEKSINKMRLDDSVALVATESGCLTIKQIQTIMKLMSKVIKRKNNKNIFDVSSFIYPFCTVTKKPSGFRMGKGKGSVFDWVMPVRKGRLILSAKRFINSRALVINFKKIQYKLPIFTRIVFSYNQ